MSRWRIACLLVLAFLCVALPWAVASGLHPRAWPSADTLHRLIQLGKTTLELVALTLVLTVPFGVVLAILLERSDLPGRRLFSMLLLATLFVPLPLFTSAWQVVLARAWPGETVWTPWMRGMGSAAWIHAVAGLPWVVLLTTWGLRGVERDLEEEGRLLLGPLGVLWQVTLPRAAGSIAAAGLFVALQTATEITVTDVMQVYTAAEEVYTQFVTPEPGAIGDPLARAVSASLGQMLLSVILVLLLARSADHLIPAGSVQLREPARVPLGCWRWPVALTVGCVVVALTAIPVGALLWRAGLSGAPPSWSAHALARQLARTEAADGSKVVNS
jgi:iron(III) transport system permease protein